MSSKFFSDKFDILYIVEKLLKNAIQWYNFREIKIFLTKHKKVYHFLFMNSLKYYINIEDYYINTIHDMQNEMNFFYHCKKFEYNHDYVMFL